MLTTRINMLVAVRLPGMYELLSNAADRMRPIWITHPDAGSVLTAGEKYSECTLSLLSVLLSC